MPKYRDNVNIFFYIKGGFFMEERKIWFITRPERDPITHKDALLALKEATNNFTLKWRGNRVLHKRYEEVLNSKGIKRDSVSNDGSGGRTWAAMLRTFSYCYLNEDGFLVLTKVGKKIIQNINVYENIKKQILTLQIPNAYFLESGFRPQYEKGFAIRPVRFLIKLCLQKELSYYLTKEEITFFAMCAKKDNQLDAITDEIIMFRQSSNEFKRIMKHKISDIYDHRERSDKGARDFESAHSDVAHTFMLISKYTGLVEYRDKTISINKEMINSVRSEINKYDQRYPFNNRYLISLQRMAENNGLDIDSYKASNYGDIKPASNRKKTLQKAEQLLYQYSQPTSLSYDKRYEILLKEFPEAQASELASEFENKETLSTLDENFIESYINQCNNKAFEDKTGEVLKAIGFDVVMRPKPNNNESTEIEILAKYGTSQFGIIDAKNYKEKFSLSASLASHMASEYIRNYNNYENRHISFFGYVTANDIAGVKNLQKISRLAKQYITNHDIKGFIINAKTLLAFLDYCIENDIPVNERIRLFLRCIDNSAYTNFNILLNKIKK